MENKNIIQENLLIEKAQEYLISIGKKKDKSGIDKLQKILGGVDSRDFILCTNNPEIRRLANKLFSEEPEVITVGDLK